MDNVKNAQKYRKTIITFIVLTIGLAVALTPSISNVNAVPPSDGWRTSQNCTKDASGNVVTCCWREPIPGSILGQKYCQTCDTSVSGVHKCKEKEKQMEQIKTPDSSNPLSDEQMLQNPQTIQPSANIDDEITFEEDITTQELEQDTLSDGKTEQNSEENNPDDSELSSESADSEQSTSFAKKGNGQNSPIPPECPKQGPIPPDCTLKPKF